MISDKTYNTTVRRIDDVVLATAEMSTNKVQEREASRSCHKVAIDCSWSHVKKARHGIVSLIKLNDDKIYDYEIIEQKDYHSQHQKVSIIPYHFQSLSFKDWAEGLEDVVVIYKNLKTKLLQKMTRKKFWDYREPFLNYLKNILFTKQINWTNQHFEGDHTHCMHDLEDKKLNTECLDIEVINVLLILLIDNRDAILKTIPNLTS